MSEFPIFSEIANELASKDYEVIATDFNRPWGGFFVLNETKRHQVDLKTLLF